MLVQLQYLRAIAALMVVYFHAVLQVTTVNHGLDWQLPPLGETGVDIFFVLSGFVMWLTTASRDVTPVEFYRRRIRRIVPIYWLATLFSAAVAFVAPSILKSTVFDVPHLVASLLFLPWSNPADPGQITPVVVPGWTLNFEMFFYLVFGMLLLVPERRRAYALAGAMTAIILVCRGLPAETTATTFYGDPIVYEFVAGVFLARLYRSGVRLRPPLAWVALVLGFAFLAINERLSHVDTRALMWGVPAIVIIYSAVSIDFSKLPTIGLLGYLGDASYAIYITHPFILAALRVVCNTLNIDILANGAIFVAACLVLSAAAGSAFHELTSFDRWTRKKKAALA